MPTREFDRRAWGNPHAAAALSSASPEWNPATTPRGRQSQTCPRHDAAHPCHTVRAYADFFEKAAHLCKPESSKQIANWFISEVLRLLGESGKTLADCKLTPEALAELVTLLESRVINGPTAKELLPELFEKGGMPKALVDARGLGQVSDAGALQAFVDQAAASNPKSVADHKAGKKAAAGWFVGQVMKLSKGKADPKLVGRMVAEKLASM